MFEKFLNQPVIIRSAASGVHYGTLLAVKDDVVHLQNSRRLWRWKIAGQGISLSEVAIHGIDYNGSKITSVLPDLIVMDVCEIIPAYGMAQATIEQAPIAEAE